MTEDRKLNIPDWPEEDRPREKLMEKGATALSDAELLAILIGSGSTKESAVALMKRVMTQCNNNLNTLGKMSLRELMQFHGIGEAKAITIMAACELGKRRAACKPEEREKMASAEGIYQFMHPKMQDLDVEEAWILMMNQQLKLIKATRLSHGGLSETAVDIRVAMREAVLNNTTVLALCHNHPSNNRQPSHQDDQLTKRMKEACNTLRIHFLDHIIICDGTYYSYNEEGRL